MQTFPERAEQLGVQLTGPQRELEAKIADLLAVFSSRTGGTQENHNALMLLLAQRDPELKDKIIAAERRALGV